MVDGQSRDTPVHSSDSDPGIATKLDWRTASEPNKSHSFKKQNPSSIQERTTGRAVQERQRDAAAETTENAALAEPAADQQRTAMMGKKRTPH